MIRRIKSWFSPPAKPEKVPHNAAQHRKNLRGFEVKRLRAKLAAIREKRS